MKNKTKVKEAFNEAIKFTRKGYVLKEVYIVVKKNDISVTIEAKDDEDNNFGFASKINDVGEIIRMDNTETED